MNRNITGNFQSHRKYCVEDIVKCIKEGFQGRLLAKKTPKTTVK